jgi:hypothetical protein
MVHSASAILLERHVKKAWDGFIGFNKMIL